MPRAQQDWDALEQYIAHQMIGAVWIGLTFHPNRELWIWSDGEILGGKQSSNDPFIAPTLLSAIGDRYCLVFRDDGNLLARKCTSIATVVYHYSPDFLSELLYPRACTLT